ASSKLDEQVAHVRVLLLCLPKVSRATTRALFAGVEGTFLPIMGKDCVSKGDTEDIFPSRLWLRSLPAPWRHADLQPERRALGRPPSRHAGCTRGQPRKGDRHGAHQDDHLQ